MLQGQAGTDFTNGRHFVADNCRYSKVLQPEATPSAPALLLPDTPGSPMGFSSWESVTCCRVPGQSQGQGAGTREAFLNSHPAAPASVSWPRQAPPQHSQAASASPPPQQRGPLTTCPHRCASHACNAISLGGKNQAIHRAEFQNVLGMPRQSVF